VSIVTRRQELGYALLCGAFAQHERSILAFKHGRRWGTRYGFSCLWIDDPYRDAAAKDGT